MKRLILGVGLVILSLVYFAEPGAAQDITGSWDLTITPPQRGGGGGGRGGGGGGRGDRGGRGGRGGGLFGGGPLTLVFSVQADALQGSLQSDQGTVDLTDVMLDGNQITFTLSRQTQRGSFETTYHGEVDGDRMSGTFEVGQGQFSINWRARRADN